MCDKVWILRQKRSISLQVREDTISLRMKPVIREQTELLKIFKKLSPADDHVERIQVLEKLRELKRCEDEISAISDDDLFVDRFEEYDWMKLSAQCFDTLITPESCKWEEQ